jgi:hypothetical protein
VAGAAGDVEAAAARLGEALGAFRGLGTAAHEARAGALAARLRLRLPAAAR